MSNCDKSILESIMIGKTSKSQRTLISEEIFPLP